VYNINVHSPDPDPDSCGRFLHRLQQYGLLEMTVSEAFDRLEAGERSDPTTTRSSKIAIFKMCASKTQIN